MDDFTKYEQLHRQGVTQKKVYEIALADNLDPITLIRMMRKVFGLSLREVKEIKIAVLQPSDSLGEYQDQFLCDVEVAVEPIVDEPLYEHATR
jgi:hypothetical protein